MKKWLCTALLFLALSFVQAHEFWLLPKKFVYQVGEAMVVDFMVGENFEGEFWDMNRHRVEKLEISSGGMVKNLLKDVKPSAGKNLTYKFDREGTHMLGLESNAASIELDGEKFNAYLKEDGLDNILDARTKANELAKPAKEFYKRFAKLFVQSGKKLDETYRRRMQFRYEIVPATNPYALKSGDYLECRLLWENKPAPHSLVKVWSHVGNRIFLQDIYTEDDGTIKFPISSKGPW
ncbi:MAG TPA: DUF4198 domain-containing protein, partial [Cyclobacteriaceae bacterium]|nr:DUF4198 domain-containing protein [Cyclobacteriaceae bacterium]